MNRTTTLILAASAVLASVALAPTAAATGCATSHDCFADALQLPNYRPLSFSLDVRSATVEAGETLTCATSHTMWASFVASETGTAHVKQISSTTFTPAVAVFTWGSTSLTRLGCDIGSNADFADVTLHCVAGTTYYIQVGARVNGTMGSMNLELDGCGPDGVAGPTLRGDYLDLEYTHSEQRTTVCQQTHCDDVRARSTGRVVADTDPANTNTEGRTVEASGQDSAGGSGAPASPDSGEVAVVIIIVGPPPGVGPGGNWPSLFEQWVLSVPVHFKVQGQRYV